MRHSIGAAALVLAAATLALQPMAASAAPRAGSTAAIGATTAAPSTAALAWSTQGTSGPPARSGAAMAYDGANDYLLLFGGTGASGQILNDTWEFNGAAWTEVNQPGMPALTGASMAYDATLHQVILFGGLAPSGQPQNQTWTWNPLTGWALPPNATSATSPPARYDAALSPVEAGNGSFVLFGGIGAPPAASPDIAGTPGGTTSTTNAPAATAARATGADGTTPLAALSDTWTWTGQAWTRQATSCSTAPAGTCPSARAGATATWDPALGEALLYGGSSDGTADALLGDLWAWGGAGWTSLQPAAPLPAPRENAVLAEDPQAGGDVLIGGMESGGPSADAWLYGSGGWSPLQAAGTQPAATAASAAWDGAISQLVLFGGYTPTGSALGTTYLLGPQGSAPSTTTPTTTRTTGPSTPASSAPPAAGAKSPPTTGAASGIMPISGAVITPTTIAPAVAIKAAATTLHPGQRIEVSGSGYRPGAQVAVWLHSAPVLLGHATANASGRFALEVTIPANTPLGAHHFEAQGMYQTGQLESFTLPVQITLPPPPGHSHVQAAVLLGVALAVPAAAWGVMALAGRRRKAASTP